MAGERPSQEIIDEQRRRLSLHRKTLSTYLDQLALTGRANARPEVSNGITEARQAIARIKARIRGWGEPVDDHPDDEEHPDHVVGQGTTAATASGIWGSSAEQYAQPADGPALEFRPSKSSQAEQVFFALLLIGLGLYGLAGLVQPSLLDGPVGLPEPLFVLLIAIGALGIAGAMLYDLYRRRNRVLRLFVDRLEYINASHVTKLSWADVDQIWRNISQPPRQMRSLREQGPTGPIVSPYLLSDVRGQRFALPDDLHPRADIEQEIRVRVGDHLLPRYREEYRRAGVVSFGESLGLSRGGVRFGGTTFPWTDVIEAGEEPRLVWLRTRSKAMRHELQVKGREKMHNVFAFVELVNDLAGRGRL